MRAAEELAALLPQGTVATDPLDLGAHASDMSATALLAEREASRPNVPGCVVRPRETAHVAAVLEWADRARVPVHPYGGGSGVGGGIAPQGGIALDMRSMAAVGEVDEHDRLVTAQAGVLGRNLEDRLAARGYTLGHAPQSIDISTVGGWIATRATGQLSSYYGGIEDVVVALEAVLPGGRVVAGKAVPRRAAGPDVLSLLIGSEGALGVVTAATLRVSLAIEERSDLCVRFSDMDAGIASCRAVAQSDLRPTMTRLYDAEGAFLFFRHRPDPPAGPLLLASFHGTAAAARAESAAALCDGLQVGADPVADWWEHRNDAVAEYPKVMAGDGVLGPHGVVETIEVSGRWSDLPRIYRAMKKALGSTADVAGCHLSHVYVDGGCLYFTVAAAPGGDDEARARLDGWWEAAMEACLGAGGSISHHHGIGRRRAPWLPRELGASWEVLKSVKAALDPNGIMNPGVLGL